MQHIRPFLGMLLAAALLAVCDPAPSSAPLGAGCSTATSPAASILLAAPSRPCSPAPTAAITFINGNDGRLLLSAARGCSMRGCWGPLYRTTDGGRHWVQLQPSYHWQMGGEVVGPPGFPGAPVFAGPLAGWIPIDARAGPIFPPGPDPFTIAVDPPVWTPIIGNIGRGDILTLHLFGSATGQFTVTIGNVPGQPLISFGLDVTAPLLPQGAP